MEWWVREGNSMLLCSVLFKIKHAPMTISIFDIAANISWTDHGRIYLTLKDPEYELLVEYLNAGSPENIEEDIKVLEKLQVVQRTQNKDEIEKFIMSELEGFTEYEDGVFAHIAGAHDLSTSVHYDIQNDSVSLKHPNLPSLERFVIAPGTLVSLLGQMKRLKEVLITP